MGVAKPLPFRRTEHVSAVSRKLAVIESRCPFCAFVAAATDHNRIDEQQLTHGVGDARSPVLSRDGMPIAFAAVAPGYTNPQIWVGRADGSAPPRPLTNDESKNYDPELSPDGRRIYFTSSREPQGIYQARKLGVLVSAGAATCLATSLLFQSIEAGPGIRRSHRNSALGFGSTSLNNYAVANIVKRLLWNGS